MLSSTIIRIDVVGAGLIGARHVGLLDECQRTVIGAIVDPTETGRELAKRYGIVWFASIDERLKVGKADGAIIATPNHLHVDTALQCMSAGMPVLVEKPIADTAASAQLLINEAAKLNIPVLVGHHRRHNPIIKSARQCLQDGQLGKIVSVHASCWLYKPDEYFNVDWRTKKGAGPVFINLIHDIDLLRHLVGEVASVQAVEANQARGHEVEDTAVVLLIFENGAVGTVTVSDTIVAPWSWELTAGENPAYPVTNQSSYLIGGTHGSLEIPSGRIWHQEGERSWWQPILQTTYEVEPVDPLMAQIEHFCDVIAGTSEPVVPGKEGLKSLTVIEAIKHAARTGERVSLIA